MRVKLAYSVDIEEIIGEVSRLFDYVADKEYNIRNQMDMVADLLEEERPEGSLALMQKMRASLGEMDARLADLSLILEGYIQYQKQQSGGDDETSSGRPTVDTADGNARQGTEQSDGGEVQ